MKIAKTVNEAMYEIAKDLQNAEEHSPRGQKVKELLNYSIAIEHSKYCVCTIPARKINREYIDKELEWYKMATRDISFISQYAKMWSYVADNATYANSNYGIYIWEQKTPTDITQFEYVKQCLIKDKDSRQAIININQVEHKYDTKDFPCFAGSTIVHSPQGNITIASLAKKFESGKLQNYPIYTLNEYTGDVEIKNCFKAFKKDKKHKLVNVQFDYGSVACTPEHLFLIKRRVNDTTCKKHASKISYKWIEAQHLEKNDKIVPIRYIKTAKCIEYVKNTRTNWSHKNRAKVHREYASFLEGEIGNNEVHHINLNPYDNKASNLLVLSKQKHRAIHQVINNTNTKTFQNLDKRINNYNNKMDYILQNNKVSKVVSVDKISRNHDVYDLCVEDNHNFFVNSGVCVHNCTINLQFFIRDDCLHMIVNMRSNDAIFGFGNDVPFFSYVHQMLTQELKEFYPSLIDGTYYHNAGSMHVYERHYDMLDNIIKDYEKDSTLTIDINQKIKK